MIVRLKCDLSKDKVPRRLSMSTDYVVIACEYDSYRLVNDGHDPVLYDMDLFDIVEPTKPANWVWEDFGEGDGAWTPKELLRMKYVWEDYHDRVPEAVEMVNDYLSKLGPTSWERRDD